MGRHGLCLSRDVLRGRQEMIAAALMRTGGAGMLTLVWLGIVVAHVRGVVEGLVVVMQRERCLAT
jgi:hypothetical protein